MKSALFHSFIDSLNLAVKIIIQFFYEFSFLEIIHSKFQELFIQNFKNYSFKEIIYLIFLRIIYSKKNSFKKKRKSFIQKIFIQKNLKLFIQKKIHSEKNGNNSFKNLFN